MYYISFTLFSSVKNVKSVISLEGQQFKIWLHMYTIACTLGTGTHTHTH